MNATASSSQWSNVHSAFLRLCVSAPLRLKITKSHRLNKEILSLVFKGLRNPVSLLEGVRKFGVTLCWVGGCFQKMEFSSLRLTRAAEAWIFFACKACSPSLAATHFWNISHLTSRTPASILCSLLTVVPGGARRGVRRNSSASLCWLCLRPRIPSTS